MQKKKIDVFRLLKLLFFSLIVFGILYFTAFRLYIEKYYVISFNAPGFDEHHTCPLGYVVKCSTPSCCKGCFCNLSVPTCKCSPGIP